MPLPPTRPLALTLLTALTALTALATGCGREAARVGADSGSAIAADLRRAARADSAQQPSAAPATEAVPAAAPADSDWAIGPTGVPHRVPRAGAAVSAAGPDTTPANTSWCASPRDADQQRCLRVHLAADDAQLNATYQALIEALVRRDGGAIGRREPASVRALRQTQRAWLGARDADCRALGRDSEGPLWAPSRARCLGARASMRAAELAAELSVVSATDAR